MNNGALLVFTRAPIPGATKTRLIPLLGAQGAAAFHQAVLLKTLQTAEKSQFSDIEIWTDTPCPFIEQCGQYFSYAVKQQKGRNLGEKMAQALAETLLREDFAVLVGSDCPELTPAILNQAHLALVQNADVVLGPAVDGGYYLIGLRRMEAAIFQELPWGSGEVAARTRAIIARLKLKYVELAALADIDTPADYLKHCLGFRA